MGISRRFPFCFRSPYGELDRLVGITPATAWAELTNYSLYVHFGPWDVLTPLSNVCDATVTGPYRLIRTIGPARLSLADRGLTFATNCRAGACVRFYAPVPGVRVLRRLRHPNVTLTLADPAAFVAALKARS